MKDGKISNCQFKVTENEICYKESIEGYEYCEEHLYLLTKIYSEQRIYDILVEQLCVPIDMITPESSLVANLGADSLDLVEITMMFQEVFNIVISDEEAERISTVKEVCDRILSKLIKEKKYITKPYSAIAQAKERIKKNHKFIQKKIAAIINTDLFKEYLRELKIPVLSITKSLALLIRDNWIEIFTTVPNYINEKLKNVYVILLSKKYIFYVEMRELNFSFRQVPLTDISLIHNYQYNQNGGLLYIEIISNVYTSGVIEKHNFIFKEEEGIKLTNKFIEKYLEFKENSR